MKHLIFVAAFLACFLWLAFAAVSPAPYLYDEADYAFDAGLGLTANFTDSPTLPIDEFIRQGLGRGRATGARSVLSESIRGSNDVVFYRHWHGPLYFYWLILTASHSEHATRLLSLVFPILSFLIIYFGCLEAQRVRCAPPSGSGTVSRRAPFCASSSKAGQLQALLGSALFLFSWTTLGSTELAPHQLFATCCLLGLFLLAKMVATGERRYLYQSAAVAGLAFCTLEVAFVLILTLAVCAVIERRRLALDWRAGLKALLIFAATTLIVWPGALLKLSFVKAYLFMAYLAVLRKSPWGNITLLDTWSQRFQASPVEWAVIAVALGLLAFRVRIRRLYPFVVFAVLMILATLRVTAFSPRYALPFMPAVEVLAALVLGSVLGQKRCWVALPLSAALLASTWLQVRNHPPTVDHTLVASIDLIRENRLETATLLVPQDYLPSVHYYFPQTHLRGYYGSSPAPAETDGADGVLYRANPVRFERLLPR